MWVQAKRPSIYALEPQLRRLQMPLLLIVGEHDEGCLRVHAFMGRTIPNAARHVVAGAGHLTNLEAPEALTTMSPNSLTYTSRGCRELRPQAANGSLGRGVRGPGGLQPCVPANP